MIRSVEQLRRALADAAALAYVLPGTTWRDVLFAQGQFHRPGDPDRRLLAALLPAYRQLDEHSELLPARLHEEWLSTILGIPRLPVVPDRIVAHATADPKRAPVVLHAGTLLRGGKDAAGGERRYATADDLTAHAASLVGVRCYTSAGPRGTTTQAPPWPLDPARGSHAEHSLQIASRLLAFRGGTMTVRLRFPGGSTAHLQQATWTYQGADGKARPAAASGFSGETCTLVLQEACGTGTGTPWVRAAIESGAVPTAFQFSGVTVEVTSRQQVVPDAGAYNDGLIDVSKEFRPFGDVARRGDAFYLRSDEAFGKPLSSLTVQLLKMPDGAAAMSAVAWNQVPATAQQQVAAAMQEASLLPDVPQEIMLSFQTIWGMLGGTASPRVEWQRRIDGDWEQFGPADDELSGITASLGLTDPCSQPARIAGAEGHYIRAFLAEGDFGWQQYQEDLAAFAKGAAAQADPLPDMPTPPDPVVVSRALLSYTTHAEAAELTVTNGWSVQVHPPGTAGALFRPFSTTAGGSGITGSVAIGTALGDASLGSSVSLYLQVRSAAPCGDTPAGAAAGPDDLPRWEYWSSSGWRTMPVVDGTRRLRQSGILRVLAPTDWASGCPEVNESTGRWLRLATGAPEQLGILESLTPDAVLAAYRSRAHKPAADPTPAVPLPAGAIKGPVNAVPGIKKIGNLAGVPGRGPETTPAYRRRAAALTRHRGRAVTAWDYERIVAERFPEVAAVRCLPHTGADGARAPGTVGLVVIPDQPHESQPRPSVSLAEQIRDALAPLVPVHASVAVLCPLYVPVAVTARLRLRRGVAGLIGRQQVLAALQTWLHPTGTSPVRFGRSLHLSVVQAFLERLPEVDSVVGVTMATAGGTVTGVTVDACRGLVCSAAAQHDITVEEQDQL